MLALVISLTACNDNNQENEVTKQEVKQESLNENLVEKTSDTNADIVSDDLSNLNDDIVNDELSDLNDDIVDDELSGINDDGIGDELSDINNDGIGNELSGINDDGIGNELSGINDDGIGDDPSHGEGIGEVISLTEEEKTYVYSQTTNSWLEMDQVEKDDLVALMARLLEESNGYIVEDFDELAFMLDHQMETYYRNKVDIGVYETVCDILDIN